MTDQQRLAYNERRRSGYAALKQDPQWRARRAAQKRAYWQQYTTDKKTDPDWRNRRRDSTRLSTRRRRSDPVRRAEEREYERRRKLNHPIKRTTRLAQQAWRRMRYWTDSAANARAKDASAAKWRRVKADPARLAQFWSTRRAWNARRSLVSRISILPTSRTHMTPDKSHQLIKEWRKIMADKKSVDYRLAQWAHNVRSEFPAGTTGDTKCSAWLSVELGLTKSEQVEMLLLARSFKVVPDQEIWTEQGATQIRKLVDLPKAEQVAALSAAKAEKRKIGSVLKSRADAASFRAGRADQPDDAKILARFARGLSDAVLADIAARAVTSDNTIGATPAIVDAARRHMARLRNRSTPIRRAA